jgi:hypothetical protein
LAVTRMDSIMCNQLNHMHSSIEVIKHESGISFRKQALSRGRRQPCSKGKHKASQGLALTEKSRWKIRHLSSQLYEARCSTSHRVVQHIIIHTTNTMTRSFQGNREKATGKIHHMEGAPTGKMAARPVDGSMLKAQKKARLVTELGAGECRKNGTTISCHYGMVACHPRHQPI